MNEEDTESIPTIHELLTAVAVDTAAHGDMSYIQAVQSILEDSDNIMKMLECTKEEIDQWGSSQLAPFAPGIRVRPTTKNYLNDTMRGTVASIEGGWIRVRWDSGQNTIHPSAQLEAVHE